MATVKRVAVIGAGTAGLCSAKQALVAGMQVTLFEQADQVGGTWVYTDNIGKDEHGLDVHTSMYKGLRTNLPKEIMGFPDFPIPKQPVSYIPAEDMLKFLNLYAETFNVKDVIKFKHHVLRIRPIRSGEWEIIVRDLKNDRLETYLFDAVMICNGHYHTPQEPKYPGSEVFQGKQIHSHDYRCADPFEGNRVLVIGAGPSGMDLAYEISKKAKSVILSHHLKEKPKTIFPDNVQQMPDILKITENGVIFVDDTFAEIDVIFYCTGYRYTFPFLSIDCGISVDENFVKPLYKHCININRPTMCFIGLPFYVCASQMFDLQARFCINFWSGKVEMPSKEEMQEDTDRDMAERWAKGYKKRQAHMMGPEQGKYYADLASTGQLEPLRPVITRLHNESSKRFLDDLINFRNDVFEIVDDETYIKVK